MTSCPSFGNEKNYQVEHYFPANFLSRVMKRQLSKGLGLPYYRKLTLHEIKVLEINAT